jgi:hypothetical protein
MNLEPADLSDIPILPEDQPVVDFVAKWMRVQNQSAKIGDDEEWSSWFVVEQQMFRIGITGDRESASWMCFQFAKAMAKTRPSRTEETSRCVSLSTQSVGGLSGSFVVG